jgi:hypothetical protein
MIRSDQEVAPLPESPRTPRRSVSIGWSLASLLAAVILAGAFWPDRSRPEPVVKPDEPGKLRGTDVLVDVGREAFRAQLGYGWGPDEVHSGRSRAWIKRHEADVNISLQAGKTYTLWLLAKPFLIKDKFQNIGLFVNGQFLGSSPCAYEDSWQWHRFDVPTAQVKAATRIIIRLGYVRKPSGSSHKRGLLVDKIVLRPNT